MVSPLDPQTLTFHVFEDPNPSEDSPCLSMNSADFVWRSAQWLGLSHASEPSLAVWRDLVSQQVSENQGFETQVFFIGGSQKVFLDQNFINNLKVLFTPKPRRAEEEREKISVALQYFERNVLPKAFVINDVGGWAGNEMLSCPDFRQQDCFDEQASVLPFLLLLNELKLLEFHDIQGEVYNSDHAHVANALVELADEKTKQNVWIVDTWIKNQGEPPYIGLYEDWTIQDWLENE